MASRRTGGIIRRLNLSNGVKHLRFLISSFFYPSFKAQVYLVVDGMFQYQVYPLDGIPS